MSHSYMQAISLGFPAVQCHAIGDGSVYEDIIWDSGAALPSKETLDAWIAANPSIDSMTVTKYDFRKLFTLNERIAIDNAASNTNIPAQYRATLVTILKDLELSAVVILTNPDVAAGVNLLETIGLIASGRAADILSNTPPV